MSEPKAKHFTGIIGIKGKRGRKPLYSRELAFYICKRLAQGDSLRQICAENEDDPKFPNRGTVHGWLSAERYPEFNRMYDAAMGLKILSYADDIVDIADTEPDPQKARVRIEARKFIAQVSAPKKYGTPSSGDDNGNSKSSQVILVLPDNDRSIRDNTMRFIESAISVVPDKVNERPEEDKYDPLGFLDEN